MPVHLQEIEELSPSISIAFALLSALRVHPLGHTARLPPAEMDTLRVVTDTLRWCLETYNKTGIDIDRLCEEGATLPRQNPDPKLTSSHDRMAERCIDVVQESLHNGTYPCLVGMCVGNCAAAIAKPLSAFRPDSRRRSVAFHSFHACKYAMEVASDATSYLRGEQEYPPADAADSSAIRRDFEWLKGLSSRNHLPDNFYNDRMNMALRPMEFAAVEKLIPCMAHKDYLEQKRAL